MNLLESVHRGWKSVLFLRRTQPSFVLCVARGSHRKLGSDVISRKDLFHGASHHCAERNLAIHTTKMTVEGHGLERCAPDTCEFQRKHSGAILGPTSERG